MGNCCGLLGRGESSYQAYAGSTRPPNDEKLAQTWRSTGIIGLRDRGLKELPDAVAAVGTEAKVFDATNNKLTDFPRQLAHLTSLQRLILSANSLSSIDGSVLLPLAATLKILVLDSNSITQIPDEVGSLVRLEKLSLKNNSLAQLNPCIQNLKLAATCTKQALQFLNVAANKLTELPAVLEHLPELEELDASDNAISAIPPQFGSLQKLKNLNLDNNQVSQVPPSVFLNCQALQTLSLHGNPLTPDSIQETEGFQEFEQRRRQKYNKVIAGGVLLGPRGMDEGLDRKVKQ